MNDISGKDVSIRRAVAQGEIIFKPASFKALVNGKSPKGDVFASAKIAGIMAAKTTPAIVPFCHPLNLEKIALSFKSVAARSKVVVTAEVLCSGKTGVEMEALAAVAAACLTIYDMMKWAGQEMTITNICLMHKSGGKSGTYQR
jgi:cyclic pyranopterin monophosphate synthase